MFTGLVQKIGVVKYVEHFEHNSKLCISTTMPHDAGARLGDSIAVNGVCLTITHLEADNFLVDMVTSTLAKTTFKNILAKDKVNLELALKANDFLGGHLVQGHVNDTAKVKKIHQLDNAYELTVELPEHLEKYCIQEGSITLDGISLTIAQLQKNLITINIIPHTWDNTIVQYYKTGQEINVEIDMIAKYMEKWLAPWIKSKNL